MTRRQEHILIGKRKALAAKLLARKIGYLRTRDFPSGFFDNLPTRVVNTHKVLRPKAEVWTHFIRQPRD
jgi:hypothetical protein